MPGVHPAETFLVGPQFFTTAATLTVHCSRGSDTSHVSPTVPLCCETSYCTATFSFPVFKALYCSNQPHASRNQHRGSWLFFFLTLGFHCLVYTLRRHFWWDHRVIRSFLKLFSSQTSFMLAETSTEAPGSFFFRLSDFNAWCTLCGDFFGRTTV